MKLLVIFADFLDFISDSFILLFYLSFQSLNGFSMIFFNFFVIAFHSCLDFHNVFICFLYLFSYSFIIELQVLVEGGQFRL